MRVCTCKCVLIKKTEIELHHAVFQKLQKATGEIKNIVRITIRYSYNYYEFYFCDVSLLTKVNLRWISLVQGLSLLLQLSGIILDFHRTAEKANLWITARDHWWSMGIVADIVQDALPGI
jgi:hypothetical protein